MLHHSSSRHVIAALRQAPLPPPYRTIASSFARFRTTPSKFQPIDPSHPLPDHTAKNSSPVTSNSIRYVPLLFASVFALGLGFYTVQIYLAASKPCTNPRVAELSEQQDVAQRYDYTAASFDSEVGFSEILMLIFRKRKQLAEQCTGHVLEASCGTGRNLGYFDVKKDGKVESLTFVDLSPAMVEVCRKKWDALYGSQKQRQRLRPDLVVRFMPGSALDPMPMAPNGRKYNTIIQTMGLCSTASPVELLENMVKHLDTSDPHSRIFLLEHGRSYLPWVNNILDSSAEKHAERHGCWFNREIGQLVYQAAKNTGMEVVRERRYHFGTTWLFELKPSEKTVEAAQRDAPTKVETPETSTTKKREDGTEAGWLTRFGIR